MNDSQRQAALDEVEAARASLVEHLNDLEDAVNIPKRVSRSVGRGARRVKSFAKARPAATAAVVVAGVVLIGAAVTLIVRASRK